MDKEMQRVEILAAQVADLESAHNLLKEGNKLKFYELDHHLAMHDRRLRELREKLEEVVQKQDQPEKQAPMLSYAAVVNYPGAKDSGASCEA